MVNSKNNDTKQIKTSEKKKQDTPSKVLTKMNKNKSKLSGKKRGRRKRKEDQREFDSRIIDIRRVTRVYKGGKRMRLSVFIAVGDKKGRVGLGIGKGSDVRTAQEKAYNYAKKNMVFIQLKGRTIPHDVNSKYKSSTVVMKPAAPGTGLIAGSAVRAVTELAGVKDLLSKRFGTSNNITIAYSTLEGLKGLKISRL